MLAYALAVGSIVGCQLLFPTLAEPSEAGTDGQAADRVARDVVSEPYSDLDGGFVFYALGSSRGYQGGTFDGRFVYLAPNSNGGPVQRFDTTQDFRSSKAWTTFDTTVVGDSGVNAFGGAAFDGTNVYFVGYAAGTTPLTPVVFMRYDRTSFLSTSSWQAFDAVALSPEVLGYSGATFDGRYLYFAPLWSTYTVRYDTTQSFTAKSSWLGFDLSAVGAHGLGFQGAIFDGRYVYLVPEVSYVDGGSSLASGFFLRYDPKLPFDSPSAWESFDTTTLDPNASGFVGGAFDGRYVYLAPFFNGLAVVARYDTKGAGLKSKSSWETFAVSKVNPSVGGFIGGAYDGRYVYFVPNENAVSTRDGILARFDTTGSFRDVAAWGSYELTQVNASAIGFGGAVFDGEYLYLVPDNEPIVVRFAARTPRLLPKLPDFFGSFY